MDNATKLFLLLFSAIACGILGTILFRITDITIIPTLLYILGLAIVIEGFLHMFRTWGDP